MKTLFACCLALFALPMALSAADLDPRTFGAKGDNLTDDTAAIQQAIAQLASTPGTLRFSPGTYRFHGLLRFKGLNRSVIDFSGATLMNLENKGSFCFTGCDGLTIRGGVLTYLQKPTVNNTKDEHPIYAVDCQNLRVDGVHILGSPFMGIVINGCHHVWVQNCRVEDPQRDGIHCIFSRDLFITDNYISGALDDAITVHDYGWADAQRAERAIISGNLIRYCIGGLVTINAHDVTFAHNQVEHTLSSGCQITTNDLFAPAEQAPVRRVARVKVIANRFLENGGGLEIQGRKLQNAGQISTGRAAIVASYLDKAHGWVQNGDNYFSQAAFPVVRKGHDFEVGLEAEEDIFPKRHIRFVVAGGSPVPAIITQYRKEGDKLVFQCEPLLPGDWPDNITGFQVSRILTDVEIIDNEILGCWVNAIYTNSIYRLRVLGNKIYNANQSNSQWTGTVVEILNGAQVDFIDNWIQDSRTPKLHKKALTITAEDARELNTRID